MTYDEVQLQDTVHTTPHMAAATAHSSETDHIKRSHRVQVGCKPSIRYSKHRAAKDPEMLGVTHGRIVWPWHAGMGERGCVPLSRQQYT